MSEISTHKLERIADYKEIIHAIINKKDARETILNKASQLDKIIPDDVIELVDLMVSEKLPPEIIKTGINKFLTLVSKQINDYPYSIPKQGSLLYIMTKNNQEMVNHLSSIKLLLKEFNKNPDDEYMKQEIKTSLIDLQQFSAYYTIKENVLFPLLEKVWINYRCLHIMWSFHEDVKRNIKDAITLISSKKVDVKLFNKFIGDIFFDMHAVKFREERILFPKVMSSIEEETLNELIEEAVKIGFPYYQPNVLPKKKESNPTLAPTPTNTKVDLKSGNLSAEQIMLIFNHLPVDITYVDEENKVRFFSNPSNRVFHRTTSILGRDVRNCHPAESVHIVEKIIDSFRSGEKNNAEFWIKMNDKLIYIQYFALIDNNNNYKGVIEVTQEVSKIQSLAGERRILNWED